MTLANTETAIMKETMVETGIDWREPQLLEKIKKVGVLNSVVSRGEIKFGQNCAECRLLLKSQMNVGNQVSLKDQQKIGWFESLTASASTHRVVQVLE